MLLFVAAYAAPNKGITVLYWFRSLSTVLSPTENSRIQGLFKASEWFSSTFQGRFNFWGLFKQALQIKVLFKPVRTLYIVEHQRLRWVSANAHSPEPSLLTYKVWMLMKTWARLVGWFCCFTSQVNSYGHCGTVSSPNHTFSWAGLNKRLTSNLCTYFRL